jgi:hypothetical protein
VFPAAFWARRADTTASLPVLIGFFAAIGFAYVAAEVAAIQQLGLLLGHPVYAVAAVLTTFLTCSGVGSAWSDRLDPKRGWQVCGVLLVLLVLGAGFLLVLVHWLQPAPGVLRVLVALACLAPPAFLMGLPFPLGLRSLAPSSGEVAWAWAANGFASVVAAPLSALVALEAGSRVLLAAAAVAYGLAAALHTRSFRPPAPVRRGRSAVTAPGMVLPQERTLRLVEGAARVPAHFGSMKQRAPAPPAPPRIGRA